MDDSDFSFASAVRRLKNGDFSWSDPLFAGNPCRIVEWVDAGRFADEPAALAEALSAACFNGRTEAARSLLDRGVDPAAGNATGLNAFHWAVNRGQLETVKLLIQCRAPLEIRNSFGGTVLGCAVWSAVNEPRAEHVRIIEELLKAGASIGDAEYPTGSKAVDQVLERYGA